MRIGIMLRAFDEKGGIGVYTRNITRHLLDTGPGCVLLSREVGMGKYMVGIHKSQA